MSTARAFSAALPVCVALTLIWALPLVLHPNSRFLGGPSDATGTIRDYWGMERQGGTPFNTRRDDLVNTPDGLELSPGTQYANAIQPAVIWGLKDAVGLVAAWNIFILAGVALTGAMTFAVLSSLAVRPIAAAFGGYAFMFGGYLVDKAYAGHGGLVQAWVFPLLLLALLRVERSPTIPRAATAGLVCAVGFYLHTYYGVIAGLMMVVFFAMTAIRRRRSVSRLALTTCFAACLLGLLVALLPALIALRHFSSSITGGLAHHVGALQAFGARIPAYIAPSSWSPLGRIFPASLQANSAEPSLFVGYTTIVLALGWLVWLRRGGKADGRRVSLTQFAAVLAGTAFVFSLPRIFSIGPVDLPAPSWFLGHVTTTIRVYARFGVLVGFGLVTLAAFSLDRLQARYGRRIAVAILILLALEVTPSLPAQTWNGTNQPASDRWLADHAGGVAAIYPLAVDQPAEQRLNDEEYYFQRFHAHPLFSYIAASMTPQARAVRIAAKSFDSPWTAHLLAAEHVRYVVLRTDVYAKIGEPVPDLDPAQFRLLARVRNGEVYRVLATPLSLAAFFRTHGSELAADANQVPPDDDFGAGFYGPEPFKYATPWRWLQQDGRVTVRPQPDVRMLTFSTLAFSNGRSRTLELFGPGNRLLGTAQVPTSMTRITFGPFPVARGASTFTLHATPGPVRLGAADARVASIFVNQPVFAPFLPRSS